mmetsp:Transcript_30855/g.77054  ORF Transcript_30855/g.77054 Transcript_30855/m.77054 type:complete len:102 (+) Transcript_30855:1173-1478(+)
MVLVPMNRGELVELSRMHDIPCTGSKALDFHSPSSLGAQTNVMLGSCVACEWAVSQMQVEQEHTIYMHLVLGYVELCCMANQCRKGSHVQYRLSLSRTSHK